MDKANNPGQTTGLTTKLTSGSSLGRRHIQIVTGVVTGTAKGRGGPPKAVKIYSKNIKKAVASLHIEILTILQTVNDLFTVVLYNG